MIVVTLIVVVALIVVVVVVVVVLKYHLSSSRLYSSMHDMRGTENGGATDSFWVVGGGTPWLDMKRLDVKRLCL